MYVYYTFHKKYAKYFKGNIIVIITKLPSRYQEKQYSPKLEALPDT